MGKPRIFVSSTYYDLKHIRNSLEGFITELGYEAVLFEDGDIVFHHDKPLDQSCYDEINNCHIFVLIIGGRYGSPSTVEEVNDKQQIIKNIKYYNSITKKEYETARARDIPIYIFIEKGVYSEYQTFKKNRENESIQYAHVDNVNIFLLIDEIYGQRKNNLIKEFDGFSDISSWLKDQWAGLFSDLLLRKKSDSEISDLSSQINDLRDVSSVLRKYSESIIKKLDPDNSDKIVKLQNMVLSSRKIKRFSQNPMINYLVEHSGQDVDLNALYDAFLESGDLESFLSNSKLKHEFTVSFLSEHNAAASADFQKLKEQFADL